METLLGLTILGVLGWLALRPTKATAAEKPPASKCDAAKVVDMLTAIALGKVSAASAEATAAELDKLGCAKEAKAIRDVIAKAEKPAEKPRCPTAEELAVAVKMIEQRVATIKVGDATTMRAVAAETVAAATDLDKLGCRDAAAAMRKALTDAQSKRGGGGRDLFPVESAPDDSGLPWRRLEAVSELAPKPKFGEGARLDPSQPIPVSPSPAPAKKPWERTNCYPLIKDLPERPFDRSVTEKHGYWEVTSIREMAQHRYDSWRMSTSTEAPYGSDFQRYHLAAFLGALDAEAHALTTRGEIMLTPDELAGLLAIRKAAACFREAIEGAPPIVGAVDSDQGGPPWARQEE